MQNSHRFRFDMSEFHIRQRRGARQRDGSCKTLAFGRFKSSERTVCLQNKEYEAHLLWHAFLLISTLFSIWSWQKLALCFARSNC